MVFLKLQLNMIIKATIKSVYQKIIYRTGISRYIRSGVIDSCLAENGTFL